MLREAVKNEILKRGLNLELGSRYYLTIGRFLGRKGSAGARSPFYNSDKDKVSEKTKDKLYDFIDILSLLDGDENEDLTIYEFITFCRVMEIKKSKFIILGIKSQDVINGYKEYLKLDSKKYITNMYRYLESIDSDNRIESFMDRFNKISYIINFIIHNPYGYIIIQNIIRHLGLNLYELVSALSSTVRWSKNYDNIIDDVYTSIINMRSDMKQISTKTVLEYDTEKLLNIYRETIDNESFRIFMEELGYYRNSDINITVKNMRELEKLEMKINNKDIFKYVIWYNKNIDIHRSYNHSKKQFLKIISKITYYEFHL